VAWSVGLLSSGFQKPDIPMFAPRATLIVLICLLSGCQTSHQVNVQDSKLESSIPAAMVDCMAPVRLPEVWASQVQLVGYEEPSEFVPRELPTHANDHAPELTLEKLERLALSSNPSLSEARARIKAVHGRWVQVGLPSNTLVGYSGQQLGSDGLAEQHGLFVGQEIVRGGKLNLNRAVVSQEIDKAKQAWATQRLRVLTDVRLAYYEVLIAQQRNETVDQLVEIAHQAVEAAEVLLSAGEMSQVEFMRSRIELQSAQLAVNNTKNQYNAAWSRLVAVVGVSDIHPQPLKGDVEGIIEEVDTDEVLARLIRESPEMAVALSEVKRARWAVDRACAEPIPNVDVEAIVQSDNGTGSSNAALQVVFPVPWLNSNQGGIRQARSEVVAANRAVDRLQLSFQQRLADVYQRYADARNQVEAYSKADGILANSKEILELVFEGYQAGELSNFELLTAQRTYSQTNLTYIQSLGQLWAAIIEIDGMLLKDSLN